MAFTCVSWSRVRCLQLEFFDRQTGVGHPPEQCDPWHLYRNSMKFQQLDASVLWSFEQMRIPPIDPSQQYTVAIAKIWNNYLGLSCLLLFLGGKAMIKYKIGGTLFSHKPSMAQWLQRRFYPVWPEVVSLTSGVVLGAFPGNSKHGTWVGETWDVIGHVSPKCRFPPAKNTNSQPSDRPAKRVEKQLINLRPQHCIYWVVVTRFPEINLALACHGCWKTQEIGGQWQFQKACAHRCGPAVRSGRLVGSSVKHCLSLHHRMIGWLNYSHQPVDSLWYHS